MNNVLSWTQKFILMSQKNIIFSSLLLFFGIISGRSQSPDLIVEEWKKHPALHPLTPQEEKLGAVIINDVRRIEYVDEKQKDKDRVIEYRTFHRLIHLNDNIGIEAYNKIYLGVGDNKDIVDIKARTILPDGRIIDIDRQNIKDLKEEDGSEYKIFAMEGLVKGCEVEYTYTFRRASTSFMGSQFIQGNFPVREALFQVTAPERLTFQAKGYNCQPATEDTVLAKRRIFSVRLKNVPAAEEEKYAAYKANLQSIEYKLAYNKATGNGEERLFTWHELAQRAFDYYSTFSDKDLTRAKELIDANHWDKLASSPEKIAAIENFIKKQFNTRKDIETDNAGEIEWILKNKLASHQGIIRLYGAVFTRLNLPYQVVMTCSRSDSRIDRSFENWNDAEETVFYFPDTKKFMAPTDIFSRYPFIDPYWGGQDVVYCRPVTIGNFNTAVAEIRPLPLEDYSQSFNKIESSLQLNASLDTVMVDMHQSFGGYSAGYYRASLTLADEEQRRNFLKSVVRFGTNSENIVASSIVNDGFESFSENKPFMVNATVKASELVENAGNKILVKIGDIIGPQTELYQEKTRLFPIEMGYPHTLERSISFRLPDGYRVKNLNDLNFNNEFRDKEGVTMGFTSEYKIEGNVIKIHIIEQYRRISYPLSEYESFRKVINSSADFNKVTLVLEKKG